MWVIRMSFFVFLITGTRSAESPVCWKGCEGVSCFKYIEHCTVSLVDFHRTVAQGVLFAPKIIAASSVGKMFGMKEDISALTHASLYAQVTGEQNLGSKIQSCFGLRWALGSRLSLVGDPF
jgi:hypothetical protein